MRLLKLDERVQQMIIDGMISAVMAELCIGLPDKDLQYEIAMKIFDNSMSVRDTERLVKTLTSQKAENQNTQQAIDHQLAYKNIEEKIKSIMGTKVSIKSKSNNKGKSK